MDLTKRYITKVARAAQRYANLKLKKTDLGPSEYECLHYIRKNGGINQEKLRSMLNIDKSAITRMVINLERKGYIYREQDEIDKRAKKLFATDKVFELKNMSYSMESYFYEWLLEDIDVCEMEIFLKVLDHLYIKSKKERVKNYANINRREEISNGKIEN